MASASSARKQAEQSGSALMDGFREAGASAKQAVSDGIEAVRGTAADYFEQGKDSARQLSDKVQSQVRDQPVKAVLIAAAAGFLVGLLYMRK
jgi:ElaB/YqjD/DUF883 family membrane-anchored ribosome-binding protein